jgi:hypothetical protein
MIILGYFELYLLHAGGAGRGPIHAKITSRDGLVAKLATVAPGLPGIFGRPELGRSFGKVRVRHGRRIP